MNTNEMTLSKDGMRLLLNYSGELDAAGLQELIALLGSARKAMEPPVPRTQQDNGGAEIACTIEPLSGFAADQPDQQGAQVLRLRSERFGWVGWRFGHNDARQLFEHLALRFGHAGPATHGSTGEPKH
jgi:hypothetical protein